jgi:integrase
LEDVLPKKIQKVELANRKPFLLEEIRAVLNAIKNNQFCSENSRFKHSHYYPFIYFVFSTGVRNAEAVGLRVENVSLEKGIILIKEVLARTIKGTNAKARIRKNTKNNKQRILPIADDLKEILLPLLFNKEPDELVFKSHTGLCIDDRMFQKRIFSEVLKKLNIEHRVLYACRHTFGSRCIDSGITPVNTAFLMGNSPQTTLRNYVHQVSLTLKLPEVK